MIEEGLDPDDWESFAVLAHEMLDRMIDFMKHAGDQPVWRPPPKHIDARFVEPAPGVGLGSRRAYQDYLEMVLPYPTGTHHPRWWGWACGSGTPMGMMAAMLGAGMNAIPGYFDDAPSRVEAQVLQWMKSVMGFPDSASGIVTGGASVANLIALTIARDAAARGAVQEHGLAVVGERFVLYTSAEAHSSLTKAAMILGLGRDAVRVVPVDDRYRMDLTRLEAQIAMDQTAGLTPFALVGTAGTINTGAIDDLDRMAEIARKSRLWFHVDGAFGAMARLSPDTSHLVSGIETADSLAFDFHKWMHVNYEAGCLLVKNTSAHRESFSTHGAYLTPVLRGPGPRPDAAGDRGLQLSRSFKALKPWMMIREQGLERIGRLVAQNVRQARDLATALRTIPGLRIVAPVSLNVVCFRYEPPSLLPDAQDALNRELLLRIQESELAVPSGTTLQGGFTLRVCLCNHRSRGSDFRDFVHGVRAMIGALAATKVDG